MDFLDHLNGVKALGDDGRYQARCPTPNHKHGDRNPSLLVTDDGSKWLVWCYAGCSTDEIVSSLGIELADLFHDKGCRREKVSRPQRLMRNGYAKDTRLLAAIWERTKPLRGTLGETYLRHRHCVLPPKDTHLRFLPGNDHYPPSLCALITDAVTAEPISLHFTRLREDGTGKAGTDRDRLLLKGHRKSGGVIRLWPNEAVTYGLGIAEGIETALCAAHGFTPVWSCIDAGNMGRLSVLDGIESLIIFADNDNAGLQAAKQCGQRWADAGINVELVIPETGDIANAVAA